MESSLALQEEWGHSLVWEGNFYKHKYNNRASQGEQTQGNCLKAGVVRMRRQFSAPWKFSRKNTALKSTVFLHPCGSADLKRTPEETWQPIYTQ